MNKIVGKIILRANVKNISPMLIATGENSELDFQVIKNCYGEPIIPASGFAGMIKESFKLILPQEDENELEPLKEYFLGTDGSKTHKTIQSHIIIDDLVLKKGATFKFCERDGVAISHETMLAIDKSKYDYELLESGTEFCLNIELTIRDAYKKDLKVLKDFLYFIAKKGQEKYYKQGAFKSNGFGILEFSDIKFFEFTFPKDSNQWFGFMEGKTTLFNTFDQERKYSFKIKQENLLKITGQFSLKNSLIIRSSVLSANDDKDLDKTHLKNSKSEPVISAKSIRGAIRHRALKILKTLEYSKPEALVEDLFGYVDKKSKSAKKGRLTTFETIVENADANQIQARIKIDRFTGGTMEGALMQSQPIWHKNEKIELRFEIEDCETKEAGLMLLMMKDLICEDLPVGGEKSIGRGILIGKSLKIEGKVNQEEISSLEFNEDGISDSDKDKINTINSWISELIPQN